MKQKLGVSVLMAALFGSVVLTWAVLGVYSPAIGVAFTIAAFIGGFWLRGAWT